MSLMTYTRDEIISATEVSRSFSKILEAFRSKRKKKFAVSRNGKIEAVIITPDALENMDADLRERIEIYNLVQARKHEKATITLEEVVEKYPV